MLLRKEVSKRKEEIKTYTYKLLVKEVINLVTK